MSKKIYDDEIYDGADNDDYAEQYRRQLERYNRLSQSSEYEDDDYDDFDEDIDEGQYAPPPVRAPQQRRDNERKAPAKSKKKKQSAYKKHDSEDIKQNFGAHKKQKKKKMNPIKKFFIIILVLALIVFIILQVLIWKYIGDVKKVETGQRNYTSGSMESDDVLNILLVGSDTRSLEERGRRKD